MIYTGIIILVVIGFNGCFIFVRWRLKCLLFLSVNLVFGLGIAMPVISTQKIILSALLFLGSDFLMPIISTKNINLALQLKWYWNGLTLCLQFSSLMVQINLTSGKDFTCFYPVLKLVTQRSPTILQLHTQIAIYWLE
jgi:hypothetical protein